jgi:hypothetical protein
MSMDIRTSTDKRLVPNTVLIRLREELGWGRPRLAKQFEAIGRRHGITTPEPAGHIESGCIELVTVPRYEARKTVSACQVRKSAFGRSRRRRGMPIVSPDIAR